MAKGVKILEKVSKVIYSINYGQDGHVFKTNIRTFIHSFYTLP